MLVLTGAGFRGERECNINIYSGTYTLSNGLYQVADAKSISFLMDSQLFLSHFYLKISMFSLIFQALSSIFIFHLD